MLKLFLATLSPLLLALPLLLAFADDAPPRREVAEVAEVAGVVDAAPPAPTLVAMASAETIIPPRTILP